MYILYPTPPPPPPPPPPPSVLLKVLLTPQALGDIEIAMKVLSHTEREEHPTDTHYHSLHCRLAPLSHEDDMFKVSQHTQSLNIPA